MALVVENRPANAGDIRDVGSIPGLGRSLGGGHGNYSSILASEIPMDRGTWQATVHRVAKSRTQLKRHLRYTARDNRIQHTSFKRQS